MFGRKSPEARELRNAKQDLNSRFNHKDADPNSPEYLAAHDRVIAAEKSKKRR